jgi:hypothetical protein
MVGYTQALRTVRSECPGASSSLSFLPHFPGLTVPGLIGPCCETTGRGGAVEWRGSALGTLLGASLPASPPRAAPAADRAGLGFQEKARNH